MNELKKFSSSEFGELGVMLIDSLGRKQQMKFISEGNLYRWD